MDRKLGGLVLLFAMAAANAQVKDSVDRFTGKRELVYSSTDKLQLGKPHLIAAATVDGQSISSNLTFMVASVTDRPTGTAWKYLRCHSMAWLVDGTPIQLGQVVHSGQVVRGGVNEVITQLVTVDQLQKLSAGKVVEYRICNDEYRLSAADMVGLGEMAAKIAPSANQPKP
jgi:hypothetical protein